MKSDPITPPASKLRSRFTLVLIALCFGAPIFFALLFQSPLLNYRPAPTKNFGVLISPVVPIPAPGVIGGAITQSAVQLNVEAQWTVLYLPPSQCGACVEQTSLLAHIRLAMGRDLDRVRLALISENAFVLPKAAEFTVRRTAPKAQLALLKNLGLEQGGVVLVDPLGNAMMRYPAEFDGTKIRKDLARLLKASQVGKQQSSGVIS
jgi:hypothetical protein